MSSCVSSSNYILGELFRLSKDKKAFDSALGEFEKIHNTARIMCELSGSDDDDDKENASTKANRGDEDVNNNFSNVTDEMKKNITSIVDEIIQTVDEEMQPFIKKRKFGTTNIIWGAHFDNKTYELKKIRCLHILDILATEPEQVLSLETYQNGNVYAEFSVFLYKNLVLPVRDALKVSCYGFTNNSLDAHLTRLLDASIGEGVWKLVDDGKKKYTNDGKPYYTYVITNTDVKKYKLVRPRL
jgi:hypothetical protein